tara:strand:- start:209 stop:406 length:198 start_codon:yes stop_codon:yes gene_type:complete
MVLEKFRITKGLSYKKLADLIGITGVSSATTTFRWCKGSRMPGRNWMKIIKEKTKGKVLPSSFYE